METIVRDVLGQLAARIKAERKLLNLSQEELANEAGVPIRTYKRFELAECDSLSVLIKIANAMELRTGHGRLATFERMFPGGVREASANTPMGALRRLEKTRAAVEKRKKKGQSL
jgi:transcriptional regulator with XRE-family HTH domain